MQTSIEAVYEQGNFRPLNEVVLAEGQHVQIAIWSVAENGSKVEPDTAFNLAEMAEDLVHRKLSFFAWWILRRVCGG